MVLCCVAFTFNPVSMSRRLAVVLVAGVYKSEYTATILVRFLLTITEYGSAPYVGMTRGNGHCIEYKSCIQISAIPVVISLYELYLSFTAFL